MTAVSVQRKLLSAIMVKDNSITPRYNRETEEAREIISGRKEAKSYGSARELFDELDDE